MREIESFFSDEFIVGLRLLLNINRNLRSKGLNVMIEKNIPEGAEFQVLRPNRNKLVQK
jgi:hypothetical protein